MSERRIDPPLAILGGSATIPQGPPPWPLADLAVRQALERAFADGSWGSYHGRYCQALCEALAELHQTPHVTLCCSGTVAVELALRGLGVGPGDEVILAGYDFPGNFRCIEATGARPVLVDVDAANWNLDVEQVAAAIEPATKAIVVSHLHGGVVAMSRLMEVAHQRGVSVVEDACQCPGATIEGRLAGTWGDVGVLSFGGSKLLTAGRGGALVTSREEIQQRVKVFGDRGNQAFPLSELQAAVLLPQLETLAERNATRAARVRQLVERSAGWHALRPLVNQVPAQPGYYKLGWQYDAAALHDLPRDDFLCAVRAEGVALDAGFRGFALRTSRRCRAVGTLDNSLRAAAGLCLLHHPVLLEPAETIDRVAEALAKVFRSASKLEFKL
jgi:dTDP-4-amino-4,6-dideoxygalactose transaminase